MRTPTAARRAQEAWSRPNGRERSLLLQELRAKIGLAESSLRTASARAAPRELEETSIPIEYETEGGAKVRFAVMHPVLVLESRACYVFELSKYRTDPACVSFGRPCSAPITTSSTWP